MFAIALVAIAITTINATAMVPADLYDMRTCGIGDLSPDGTLLIYHVGIYDRFSNQTQPTVYLRWTMSADNELWPMGGWNIDDIELSVFECAANDDFVIFGSCLAGPDVHTAPDCTAVDLDGDGDVDLGDFALFQQQFTGPQP